MKKIMFNDHYGLTQAVLDGHKSMTRKIFVNDWPDGYTNFAVTLFEESVIEKYSRYKVGEVVAIAQPYKDLGSSCFEEWEQQTKWFNAGFNNKMFVRADHMLHHIKITSIKMERLQDISNEDCMKEGITCVYEYPKTQSSDLIPNGYGRGFTRLGSTPRNAFAALTDKISGKGTWEKNPWVFAYNFELID